jgi:hypothetical protein
MYFFSVMKLGEKLIQGMFVIVQFKRCSISSAFENTLDEHL